MGGTDERVRFKKISTIIKDLATRHHILVMATVEYTKIKSGIRGDNNNIGETGQIEYDANLIAHVYNEVHELGDRAVNSHVEMVGKDIKVLPKIELNI